MGDKRWKKKERRGGPKIEKGEKKNSKNEIREMREGRKKEQGRGRWERGEKIGIMNKERAPMAKETLMKGLSSNKILCC